METTSGTTIGTGMSEAHGPHLGLESPGQS